MAGVSTSKRNCLIGDSFIERLATRPDLIPYAQKHFPNWLNLGIGGDRVQHVQWRIDHGGFPANPGKAIFACGSNNLRSNSSKETTKIANTILLSIANLQASHPSLELAVLGICPRENDAKCQAAEHINNIIEFKLPTSVIFIRPPKALYDRNGLPNSELFESDNVHLNLFGYKLVFNTIRSHMSLNPETLPEPKPKPSLSNPVHDNFAIGELEFLGVGVCIVDGKESASQSQVRGPLLAGLPTSPTPSSRPSPSPPRPMPPDPYPPLPIPCPSRPSHPVPVLSVIRQKNMSHPHPSTRAAPTARQAYPASAPTTKLACRPTSPKRFSCPRTKFEKPRGSWVAHSLSDQVRRKAPKPAPPAPYKHSPPPPLVSLSMQDNKQPKLVKKMPTPTCQLHQTKPPNKPKGTYVSETRPPKALHQLAPIARELTPPPLRPTPTPLRPTPTRSGSNISSHDGVETPLPKQSALTRFSLVPGHCMLIATVLFLLPIAFTHNAYNEAELSFYKNSTVSPVKNFSSPINIIQTNSNEHYRGFSIHIKYIDINFNFLLLLFSILCINLLKIFSNKRIFKLAQGGYRYSISDHFFNHDILNFIHYLLIKVFYNVYSTNIYELSLRKFYISEMTMSGITSATPGLTNPFSHILNFSTNYYIEGNNLSPTITAFWELIAFIVVFSVLLFSFLLYFNYKLYCKTVKKSRILKKQKSTGPIVHLFTITIFKCIILGFIILAIKQKHDKVHKPHKLVSKTYFLSVEYFRDTYESMQLQSKSFHEWYAMSKMKFKNYKSFFQFLILPSGDIAMNPGPISYPC